MKRKLLHYSLMLVVGNGNMWMTDPTDSREADFPIWLLGV